MKLNITAKGTKLHQRIQERIRKYLGQIKQTAGSESADVTIVRDGEDSPVYRVRLKVSEPHCQISAECKDHDLKDAATKAAMELGVRAWAECRLP